MPLISAFREPGQEDYILEASFGKIARPFKKAKNIQAWCSMLLIPSVGRWFSEFEASLVYRMSSRTSRATHRNPISKPPP